LAPMVRELRSLGAGAPVLMVEPVIGFSFGSLITASPVQAAKEAFRLGFFSSL